MFITVQICYSWQMRHAKISNGTKIQISDLPSWQRNFTIYNSFTYDILDCMVPWYFHIWYFRLHGTVVIMRPSWTHTHCGIPVALWEVCAVNDSKLAIEAAQQGSDGRTWLGCSNESETFLRRICMHDSRMLRWTVTKSSHIKQMDKWMPDSNGASQYLNQYIVHSWALLLDKTWVQ